MQEADNNNKKKKKKNPAKQVKPGRGLETLYRITMNNHVQFNKIADNKANLLMSVNAIIISILLSTLLPSFMKGEFLVLLTPSILLLLTCLLTIITAVLATLPKNNNTKIDLSQFDNDYGKLLFFGNFHKMEAKDFVEQMRVFQKDDKFAYDSLSQNFYILGKMLALKYKYLHIGYRIFLGGLIISIIAFVIAFVKAGTGQ